MAITFVPYGPYDNVATGGATTLPSGTVTYVAGQPIVVEAVSLSATTIADSAGLTWTLLASQNMGGALQYIWYTIPVSSGTTVITLTQVATSSYYSMRVVAYTSNAGTPSGAVYGNISGGAGISTATPFSQSFTPSSAGSAVWMVMVIGLNGLAPAPGSECSLITSTIIDGWISSAVIGMSTEPLTSSSPVTLSGTTSATYQVVGWVAYEVPLAAPTTVTRPSTDILTTGWTGSYVDIDEVTASDTDYITSPSLASPTPIVFGLSQTLAAGSYNISIRGKSTLGTGNIQASLLNSSNTVMGSSSVQPVTSGFTTYTLPITTTGSSDRVKLEVTP